MKAAIPRVSVSSNGIVVSPGNRLECKRGGTGQRRRCVWTPLYLRRAYYNHLIQSPYTIVETAKGLTGWILSNLSTPIMVSQKQLLDATNPGLRRYACPNINICAIGGCHSEIRPGTSRFAVLQPGKSCHELANFHADLCRHCKSTGQHSCHRRAILKHVQGTCRCFG